MSTFRARFRVQRSAGISDRSDQDPRNPAQGCRAWLWPENLAATRPRVAQGPCRPTRGARCRSASGNEVGRRRAIGVVAALSGNPRATTPMATRTLGRQSVTAAQKAGDASRPRLLRSCRRCHRPRATRTRRPPAAGAHPLQEAAVRPARRRPAAGSPASVRGDARISSRLRHCSAVSSPRTARSISKRSFSSFCLRRLERSRTTCGSRRGRIRPDRRDRRARTRLS